MKMWPRYVLGLAALLSLVVPGRSRGPYATDLVIVHYEIRLEPDFDRDTVACEVEALVRNLSSEPAGRIPIALCFGDDSGTYDLEMRAIASIEPGRESPLEFSAGAGEGAPAAGFSCQVGLERALAPGGEVRLEFRYVLKSRPGASVFPIFEYIGAAKELYMLADSEWLPRIAYRPSPGVFANIYRAGWDLKVVYPAGYASVVDGELAGRSETNGRRAEDWRSVTGGVPQVFLARYDVIRERRDGLTLEMDLPPDDSLKANAAAAAGDVFKILDLFSRLFGSPGGSTYRFVTSYARNGAHGLHMGLVAQPDFLRTFDLETIAHEISHTWWGSSLSSYGEGSKFLRESLAGFSSAWALKEIRGQAAFQNALLKYKAQAFFPYPARREEARQYPVLERPGYESSGIVRAAYRKGPLVLDEMRRELGDTAFFRSLGEFARRFKDRNVTMADFVRSFEETSRRNLDGRFRELCGTAGAASYSLAGFRSARSGDRYLTEVRIRNEGDMATRCPILLAMGAGERRDGFTVAPRSEAILRFETPREVVRVVLDPDLDAFQCRPEQKFPLWAKLDERSFGGANWSWFNKSYAQFRLGMYREAVSTISKYLDQAMTARGISSVQEMGPDPLFASYLFSRGLYRYAGRDVVLAEADIKAAVPGLLRAFSDKRDFLIQAYAGIVGEKDPAQELAALLGLLAGKELALGPRAGKEAGTKDVQDWAKWWDDEGRRGRLDLRALGKYAPLVP
jgi:hypothetical protein